MTNEQKAKKVDTFRAEGATTKEACEKADLKPSVYGYYKYQRDRKKTGPKVVTYDAVKQRKQKVATGVARELSFNVRSGELTGSPKALAAFMRTYKQ